MFELKTFSNETIKKDRKYKILMDEIRMELNYSA